MSWKHDEEGKTYESSGEGGVLIYIRRSAEDRSARPLQTQFETTTRYVRDCPKIKDKIPREFYVDNGLSGAFDETKRPSLGKMMSDIQELSKRVNLHVIVYDTSRLSRSVEVGSRIKSIFEKEGVMLHLAASGMVVEGANADLFFGLNMQLAANERSSTIARVKAAFKCHPGWDPRKGFGWKFEGSGTDPILDPDEQEILKEIRELFEEGYKSDESEDVKRDLSVAEIARLIQAKHGNRKSKKDDSDDLEWKGYFIDRMAMKNGWKWSGGLSKQDLESKAVEARREGKSVDQFVKEQKGILYSGVGVTKATTRKYFGSEGQVDEAASVALRRVMRWCQQEKFSVDDMTNMLNEQVQKEKPWTRQTTWRVIKKAEEELGRKL